MFVLIYWRTTTYVSIVAASGSTGRRRPCLPTATSRRYNHRRTQLAHSSASDKSGVLLTAFLKLKARLQEKRREGDAQFAPPPFPTTPSARNPRVPPHRMVKVFSPLLWSSNRGQISHRPTARDGVRVRVLCQLPIRSWVEDEVSTWTRLNLFLLLERGKRSGFAVRFTIDKQQMSGFLPSPVDPPICASKE